MEALNSIYHSGVGWFSDILDIQVYFDADLEAHSPVPHMVRDPGGGETRVEHYKPLFAGGAVVRGFARITAPPGRTVEHGVIAARLESSLFALEDVNTRDLLTEEVPIAPAGAVSGTVDVPFEFPASGARALGESFEGALFSIRHQATIVVARPWYTFPVTASAPFAVQRVHDIHQPHAEEDDDEGSGGGGGGRAGAAGKPSPQERLYGPQSLALDAFDDGSTCVFNYDKGWCVWGRKIRGGVGGGGVGASPPIPLHAAANHTRPPARPPRSAPTPTPTPQLRAG